MDWNEYKSVIKYREMKKKFEQEKICQGIKLGNNYIYKAKVVKVIGFDRYTNPCPRYLVFGKPIMIDDWVIGEYPLVIVTSDIYDGELNKQDYISDILVGFENSCNYEWARICELEEISE